MVNNHKIASKLDGREKENIIEELSVYQDASKGDGKRMATQKEDVKELIGRSPDHSDCWIMRMYFIIKQKMLPQDGPPGDSVSEKQLEKFKQNRENFYKNDTK